MTWRIAFSLLSRSASGFRYLRKTGRSCRLSACCGEARGPAFAKTEFATDSPLEGDGFEPSVPRFARLVHFPAPTPRSGIAEPVAVLVEFGAALLLGPAHLVDGLVDQFDDMEFVEGDLGLWQALGGAGDERTAHVDAHLDNGLGVPRCAAKSVAKGGDSRGILAFGVDRLGPPQAWLPIGLIAATWVNSHNAATTPASASATPAVESQSCRPLKTAASV
jgi:hypothetical protein